MISAQITKADPKDDRPATHKSSADTQPRWRKGRSGYAERFNNVSWDRTYWRNRDLDIVHMFSRLDGQPQMMEYQYEDSSRYTEDILLLTGGARD